MDFLRDYPVLLTLLIFCARVTDVSLGTLRSILVFRGKKLIAASIGFFEILVWLVAAGQVLKNLDTWYLAAGYAAGFAYGNVVGIWLEQKLALGHELVRVISTNREIHVARALRAKGHEVIELVGQGAEAVPVEVLLTVAARREVPAILALVQATDPHAICTVTDVKQQQLGAASLLKRVSERASGSGRWPGPAQKEA